MSLESELKWGVDKTLANTDCLFNQDDAQYGNTWAVVSRAAYTQFIEDLAGYQNFGRVVYSELPSWTSMNHDDSSSSSNEWILDAKSNSTLSFDWSVSSESGYDFLNVYLNGKNILQESGSKGGTMTIAVPESNTIATDFENQSSCVVVKSNVGGNSDISVATPEDGIGVNGSKGISVVSAAGAENSWDAQLWIVFDKPLSSGAGFSVSFDYKASKAVHIETQTHGEPAVYIDWTCIGEIDYDTEWKTYRYSGVVSEEHDGMKSIAFNLSADVEDDITFYLDNVSVSTSSVLRAVYSKDGSSSNGSDEGSLSNITLYTDITNALDIIANQENKLAEYEGYDAIQEELASAIDDLRKTVDANELVAKFDSLNILFAVADEIKVQWSRLNGTAKKYEEIAFLTQDSTLIAALDDANAVLAQKATYTTASLQEIKSVSDELNEAILLLDIPDGQKVWDFAFSAQTITDLNYDSYNYGWWDNFSSYYYLYSSWSGYQQLRVYSSQGEKYIPETAGLLFNQGGYRWSLYVDGTNRLYISNTGSSYGFEIPNLKKGQKIIIDYTSASTGSSRGITLNSSNAVLKSGNNVTTSSDVATYEVTQDGDVYFYPTGGAIYINSISVSVPNALWNLVDIRNEVAEYINSLDSFPGLKAELQQAYDMAILSEGKTVDKICEELNTVLGNVRKAVQLYPGILADLTEADSVLTEVAYLDIVEAVELARSIDVDVTTSETYMAAYDALETALAIYNAEQVERADWAFNTNTVYTVNGLRYYLDTTHNLAEFINFNNSNAYSGALNIPATIRRNGTSYAVVAIINNERYTQNNITSVTLPKSLRYIGDYGLGCFGNVRSIEIPESVTAMGSNVFYNSNSLKTIKMNAVVPPSISSMSGSSYKKITIPAESFHAYRIANVWKDNVLIGGEGTVVSTGKIVAGDLGHIVLDEAGYLQEVNKLIIDEGTLNNDDWNTIKSMTNLIEIDLSGVTMSVLPANAFEGRWAIEAVKLPHNLTSIGNYALRGTGIKEVELPKTLTTLGTYSFSSCDSLRTISIPEAVTTIPNYCFSDCDNLQKAELPSGLNSINQYAFANSFLQYINLPSTLTTIGNYAFNYCYLSSIEIPSGITSISEYAFANNSWLDSLVIPSSVVTINRYAFSNCSRLKSVQFSEGLTNLYGYAFQNCKNLTEIVLPSSLERCQDAPFYGCTGIKKIEARSVIPPTTGGSCPLSNVVLNNIVLTVPSWSTSEYPLADGWSSFYTVEASDFMPQYIKVNKDFYFTLRDTLAADYRPNISMIYSSVESTDAYGHTNYERGNLTVSGRSKLAVNDLSLVVSPYAKYYSDRNIANGYDYDSYRTNLNSTSLIVNGEMRAENVRMDLNNYNSRWQFVTFPFDVKVSDIVPQKENISWVIRGHNSAMRAAGKVDSVWVNLSADDILEAGKGYIMHNYQPDYNNAWFWVYPLKNSVNRQLIFSSEDRTISLEENLAEFDHNRSWNLIGNPYPCFYDTRFMDFDAPFMVWNSYSQNYVAYNPADDAYILSPGEAFFVQRPYDQEDITFRKEGRQTHRYAREMEVNVRAQRVKNAANRQVCNIILQKDTLMDRTRVVLNDKASMGYELTSDVTKFASTEKSVPQIFTMSGNIRYAINERPVQDGEVSLGIYCGTNGTYTIRLANEFAGKVILEDKEQDVFYEISAENGYVFEAKAGECTGRFVLHFQNEATGIDGIMADENDADAIYNLQGMKVNTTNQKGVYIKNGQKTIIK